jgi:hypothetical protein
MFPDNLLEQVRKDVHLIHRGDMSKPPMTLNAISPRFYNQQTWLPPVRRGPSHLAKSRIKTCPQNWIKATINGYYTVPA